MKIQVTQEDIDKGIQLDCTDCPIAVAIRRITSLPGIEVDDSHIEIDHKEYHTPDEVIEFICVFDAGLTVQPFEFDLVEIENVD